MRTKMAYAKDLSFSHYTVRHSTHSTNPTRDAITPLPHARHSHIPDLVATTIPIHYHHAASLHLVALKLNLIARVTKTIILRMNSLILS